jgi:exodeoxyribonuclease VII large subunit
MPVITVSQLNNYMKRYVDQNTHLSELWVKAEISNCKKHYSGHIYMTLKDETSSMKAVMFKSSADKLKFIPEDGCKIIAFGNVGVYERDGVYQLYVESMIPDGVGELYAAYEKLKNQLMLEGLFDDSHKKKIPSFPQNIGVVTSISGAALRDIINVIKRRYQLCDVCIYPVKVQGIGAADSICDGLNFFSDNEKCDVVILARGGGSIEDLWAFNEEKTARAIFDCKKPVICGVGHETDYTISDFVADMRAPTPSAAAELATPSQLSLRNLIDEYDARTKSALDFLVEKADKQIKNNSIDRLNCLMNSYLEKKCLLFDSLKNRMFNSYTILSSDAVRKLAALSSSLDALDPKKVLKRGYSFIMDGEGKYVSGKNLKPDDVINLVYDKGRALCRVMEVYNEKEY